MSVKTNWKIPHIIISKMLSESSSIELTKFWRIQKNLLTKTTSGYKIQMNITFAYSKRGQRDRVYSIIRIQNFLVQFKI